MCIYTRLFLLYSCIYLQRAIWKPKKSARLEDFGQTKEGVRFYQISDFKKKLGSWKSYWKWSVYIVEFRLLKVHQPHLGLFTDEAYIMAFIWEASQNGSRFHLDRWAWLVGVEVRQVPTQSWWIIDTGGRINQRNIKVYNLKNIIISNWLLDLKSEARAVFSIIHR